MLKSESAAKRVLELAGKANQGPWVWEFAGPGHLLISEFKTLPGCGTRVVIDSCSEPDGNDSNVFCLKADREFIAESRNLSPKIAEALLVAIEHIKSLEEQLTPGLVRMILRNVDAEFAEGE